MSSPPSISGLNPRLRNRRYPHTALLSRTSYNRMWMKRTFKEELTAFCTRQAEGLPFIPTYLANTVYAQLLKQQYEIYRKHCNPSKRSTREQNLKKNGTETFSEFALASPCSHQNKTTPTVEEIESLHSALYEDSLKGLVLQDLRLPTAWDMKAKGENIDISADCLQLTYTGNGKDESDVSSTRANHAMRKQCGIYYFEIQIISKGIDGHIGIGFCRKINSLDRFPGWEEHSWGYHGENGNVFSGPGTGRSYGPKYGTGDIIGCGIDFRDMSAFYTKNGIHLGTAFCKVKDTELYPFVGFKTSGEKIEVNFGSKPFKFDIQQYMANEKQELLNCIAVKSTSNPRSRTMNDYEAKNIADNVVIEYLSHNGYDKTAKSLKKALLLKGRESNERMDEADLESQNRQEIRKALLAGDIDRVFKLCEDHYPNVLENNSMLLFRLRCRKFMEMVRRVQAKNCHSDVANDEYEAQSLEISDSASIPMKRDARSILTKNKKQKLDQEDELSSLSEAMEYGNKLKVQYEEELRTNDTIRAELLTAFSTLAYTDLSDPAVAYLFKAPEIESVASELNSAILVSLGKYPNSSLERIYRQTNEIIKLLVLTGNANAALLQPEQDCFHSVN